MRRHALPALVIAVFLISPTWTGCGDDGPKSPRTPGSVEGMLTEADSGGPVTAAVVLLNLRELTAASEVVESDDAGHYRIDGVPPGEYAVVVFHRSLVARERPAPQVRVSSNKVTTFDIELVNFELLGASIHTIEGTVTDAHNSEPVPGALVGPALVTRGELNAYAAGVTLWAGVTDSTGFFSIPGLELEISQETGLCPITAAKEGYESNTLIGEGPSISSVVPPLLPLPDGDDHTLTVEIALEPVSSGGDPLEGGAIKGRLVSFGQPVANVLVGTHITFVSDPDTFRTPPTSHVPVPQKVDRTDSKGNFFIEGLTPGDYWIDPAYPEDDGFVTGGLEENLSFICTIIGSDTCDLGVLQIGRAISPVSPRNRSIVQDATPEFRWSTISIPTGYDFIGYEIQYGTGYILIHSETGLQEPRWQIPAERAFNPGDKVRWYVSLIAKDPGTRKNIEIAAFEWPATFSVAD